MKMSSAKSNWKCSSMENSFLKISHKRKELQHPLNKTACASGYNSIPVKARDSWTAKWMAPELQGQDEGILDDGVGSSGDELVVLSVIFNILICILLCSSFFFPSQYSVFAKKDYANTKQRARKKLQKDMVVGMGAREAAADKIFGLFRRRCLSFFSTDFVSFFSHMPIWKHEALNHPQTSGVCVAFFYISLFIFCFVHPQPGLVFVFVLVQQPSNISKEENAPNASMCGRVCAKVKRKWQLPV